MLKVYVSGFDAPFSIVGEFIREDERYLYLNDNGIKKKIPIRNIVLIEDASELLEAVEEKPVEPPAIQEDTIRSVIAQQVQRQQQRKVPPVSASNTDPNINPKKTSVLIAVSGVMEENFTIEVNDAALTGNSFNPMLHAEISMHPKVKAIMTNGVIYDGVPTVSNNTIHIKTRHAKDLANNAGKILGQAGILGKLASSPVIKSGLFQRPNKEYRSDFATNVSGVTSSPFEGEGLSFISENELRGNDDAAGHTDEEDIGHQDGDTESVPQL